MNGGNVLAAGATLFPEDLKRNGVADPEVPTSAQSLACLTTFLSDGFVAVVQDRCYNILCAHACMPRLQSFLPFILTLHAFIMRETLFCTSYL